MMKKREKQLRAKISAGQYDLEYEQSDYGTERVLIVTSSEGEMIGKRDPFWPDGIPANKMQRQARLVRVACEMIDNHTQYNKGDNDDPRTKN